MTKQIALTTTMLARLARRVMLMVLLIGAAAIIAGAGAAAAPEKLPAHMTGRGISPLPVQYGQRFDHPQMAGAIVDWCAVWAADCGTGGANLYCRQMGFHSAAAWDAFNPGRTFVIGSNRFCDGPNCRGFRYVVCN